MSDIEKRRLEQDFTNFTKRHFEKPSKCRNLAQVQFYVRELSFKIEELKNRYNYVPEIAYKLLREYKESQNKLSNNSLSYIYSI